MSTFSICTLLVYGLVLFAPLNLSASDVIDHQKELKKAQAWVDHFKRDYPILIFNRDEMAYHFSRKKAFFEGNMKHRNLRAEIIKDYVFQKTQVEITYSDAINIETNLFSNSKSATALPLYTKRFQYFKYKMCAVFPPSPNGTQQIETERLLGMDHDGLYLPHQNFHSLTHKLPYKTLYLFSLYHEVSHCLDEDFMPEVYKAYDQQPHDIHNSESFAETFAYLHLSQLISPEIAKARIQFRNLYSLIMGQFFASGKGTTFGIPAVTAGGAIYYLSPVITEAYSQIRLRELHVDNLSPEELYEAAKKITSKSALPYRSFSAIVNGLKNRSENLARYEELAFEDPDYYLKAYNDLVGFHLTTDLWLKKSFSPSEIPPLVSQPLPSLPIEKLCSHLTKAPNQGLKLFLKTLKNYRERLRNHSDQSSLQRKSLYHNLSLLTQTLGQKCDTLTVH